MPDLSSITLPDNVTYTFKDKLARDRIFLKIIVVNLEMVWSNSDEEYGYAPIPYEADDLNDRIGAGNYIILRFVSNNATILLYPVDYWPVDDTFMFRSLPYKSYGSQDTIEYWEGALYEDDMIKVAIQKKTYKIFKPSNSGSTGQILTKTASGYSWQSLPLYDGSVTIT